MQDLKGGGRPSPQELVGFIFDELKIICVDALQRVDALKHFPALSDRINEVAALCLKVTRPAARAWDET